MTRGTAQDPQTGGYPARQRTLATVFLILGAVMNMVDTTIANVALPQMQGTTAASREEITWVLTSYVIATAIATPLVGWLAARWSRRAILLCSIAGFTFFSVLCGLSTTVEGLVVFRICQGLAGAGLVPLTQTTLLDIYPREEHGKAMAIFGLAGTTGPLIGPLLGGWLTSNFSWGWVFLVNLPLGLIAFAGLAATLPKTEGSTNSPFDGVSYGLLAVGIGSLQLMLDRGAVLDWFSSDEILVEAAVAFLAAAGFLLISARRAKPYFPRALLMDRNFLAGTCISCVAGGVTLGGMALAPELLSQLYGYPVQDIGYMMAPRGLGAILLTPAMPFAMRQFGLRVPMATGMLMIAFANWQMSTLTLQSDSTLIYFSGLIQGFGGTLMWTPLSMLTYSTLPAHLRNDGAALYILMRALGTAVGISLLQTFTLRSAILAHAELAGTVLLQNLPQAMRDFASGGTPSEVAAMVNGEVTRQAGMIAYNRAFSLMILLNLLQLPLLAIAGKSAARRISAGSS